MQNEYLASEEQSRLDPVAGLNALYETADAHTVLASAIAGDFGPRTALVSSFGAESVVLLHMAAQIDRHVPVLFIDTEMLFVETLEYQRELARTLGLTDIRRISPDARDLAWEDPLADMNERDTDACCNLRKTRPLARALAEFDVSITGRKRQQAVTRATMPVFETEAGRIKINPLASWSRDDLAAYMDAHDLPRHPLVAQGFKSIGCAPCTSPVGEGEDPRAGRWRGSAKTECGIHFINGRFVRGNLAQEGNADTNGSEAA